MRCYNLILYYILWFVKTILGKTPKKLRQPSACESVNDWIKSSEACKIAEVDEIEIDKTGGICYLGVRSRSKSAAEGEGQTWQSFIFQRSSYWRRQQA